MYLLKGNPMFPSTVASYLSTGSQQPGCRRSWCMLPPTLWGKRHERKSKWLSWRDTTERGDICKIN